MWAVFRTAYAHLNLDGIVIVSPDEIRETFQQNQTLMSSDCSPLAQSGLKMDFVENNFDPDPTGYTYESLILCLIREEVILRIERDLSLPGLFSLNE